MWRMIALILLGVVVAAAFHWFGLQIGPFGFEGERKHIARLQREVVEMTMAGEMAIAQQEASNKAIAASYSAMAQRSQHAHQTALEGARRAVSDYVRAHRLPAKAHCGPGPAIAAGLPDPAEAPDGPATGDPMVAITRSELDAFADIAVRAASNRQWGLSLIEEGLAIPEPEF